MKAEYLNHMGDDLAVANDARVSFAKWKEEFDKKDAKLIDYLADHNHWTPFAHSMVKLRMKAPVPIRTQCFKHKQGFVENEESRRYISYTPDYFIPTFRNQVENKKQGSGEEYNAENQAIERAYYRESVEASIKAYEDALYRGVCEEQARFYLPQGVYVNWIWTGSLAAFGRFYHQRSSSHAQKEIQDLAKQVGEIIQPLFPVSWEALTGEQDMAQEEKGEV